MARGRRARDVLFEKGLIGSGVDLTGTKYKCRKLKSLVSLLGRRLAWFGYQGRRRSTMSWELAFCGSEEIETIIATQLREAQKFSRGRSPDKNYFIVDVKVNHHEQ
jgi:hypothetical protein